MRGALLLLLLGLGVGPAAAQSPAATAASTDMSAAVPDEAGFQAWIGSFRGRALAAGITGALFDAAFAEVHLNATVIDKDRHQNEFSKTIWDYLDTAVSEARVENGRRGGEEEPQALDAIEARYGVEAEVVAAIWGVECELWRLSRLDPGGRGAGDAGL